MPPARRPQTPLDAAAVERLALRYVERYATTRARLAAYLTRKLRERGAAGAVPDPAVLAERMASLGYVDDRAFGEARAASMARRGLGARRVRDALRMAGVGEEDAVELAPVIVERSLDSAIAFARRRRIGPFATVEADRNQRQRQVAAMLRAGHDATLAWRIATMAPGSDVESLDDAN